MVIVIFLILVEEKRETRRRNDQMKISYKYVKLIRKCIEKVN